MPGIKLGAESGYVELAFGHHRLDAARLAGLADIPIELEEFSDGDMLMWMARENVQGSMPIMMEAISGAVRALAEGKLEIEAISKDTKKEYIRYAPSFIPGKQPAPSAGARPYTLKILRVNLRSNLWTQRLEKVFCATLQVLFLAKNHLPLRQWYIPIL